MPETDLTNDHKALTEDQAARRYFRKFGRITELLTGVAGTMAANRSGIQGATVRRILIAWGLTLPACMTLSGVLLIIGRVLVR